MPFSTMKTYMMNITMMCFIRNVFFSHQIFLLMFVKLQLSSVCLSRGDAPRSFNKLATELKEFGESCESLLEFEGLETMCKLKVFSSI